MLQEIKEKKQEKMQNKSFKLYLEACYFEKGDVIKNHRNENLIVLKDYKIWWKSLLKFLTLNFYKPYKSPFIYIVKIQ